MEPKTTHLLVVEDNPVNSELLCDWLEIEGYAVSRAETLEQAFAALRNKPPDIVLLDIQLGSEDGAAVAVWMRQQPALRHIPVLAVTAHAMVAERQGILQAGCNACISKPIDFGSLRSQLLTWEAALKPGSPEV